MNRTALKGNAVVRTNRAKRHLGKQATRVAVATLALVAMGAVVNPALASVTITEYAVPTTDSFPALIAAGPDGNLWFPEHDGNNVAKVTTSGGFTEYPIPTPAAN